MTTHQQKCEAFARLHEQEGAFVIPNPWDAGSARLLEGLGFQALATSSAAFAFTLAKPDGRVTLDEKLSHCQALARVTSIPINADFEDGFAAEPARVAENVLKVAATGVAGCSVEDFGRDSQKLYDFDHAVERVQAAAEAVASLGMPFQLTARAENLLRGVGDLDETIRRLKAFAAAGADVLYAPAVSSLEDLRRVTAELERPFNALAPFFRGASVAELAAAGARRISVGGALGWAAINPLLEAGKEMLAQGTFEWTRACASGAEVRRLMS